MNSIIAIHPYVHKGMWVFDDESKGLVKEPFVGGSDLILDRLVEGIPDAMNGVTVLFSETKFPGWDYGLEWCGEDLGGNWYRNEPLGMNGWLCPALLKYFDKPPKTIFLQVKAKNER